ncbi:hypothetical protein V1477_018774 [Vespula maculifrons]|uniref:Uncharacterized protein n=1 Tax=Vespula maculifrons TaxID=7453 RepID=A0ABD2AWD1_VESMC
MTSDGVPSTRRNLDQHPTCPMQKAQSIDHSLGGSYVGEVNTYIKRRRFSIVILDDYRPKVVVMMVLDQEKRIEVEKEEEEIEEERKKKRRRREKRV